MYIDKHYPFEMIPLKYSLTSFSDFLDFQTLSIHYNQIYKGYIDELNKNYKVYTIIKESIIGLSGFVSIVFLYYEKYTGAIITNAISTLSIILENIFKFNNYEQKIKKTQSNVNDLWYMKKELTNFKEYLKNDIVSWKDAKKSSKKILSKGKKYIQN